MNATCHVPTNIESPPVIPIAQPAGTTLDVARNPDAGLHQVEQRLAELDTELNIERALADAGAAPQLGVTLTRAGDPQYLLLPAAAGGIVIPHGTDDSAHVAARNLGLRTEKQIEKEREVLEAIKSDLHEHLVADKLEAIARFEDEGGPAVEPAEQEEPSCV
jgi:hypothetical protein